MIDQIFNNDVYLWLLITAIVFTFVGRMQVRADMRRRSLFLITNTVESTVDNLIKEGFIKTRKDENGEVELLKHWEDK